MIPHIHTSTLRIFYVWVHIMRIMHEHRNVIYLLFVWKTNWNNANSKNQKNRTKREKMHWNDKNVWVITKGIMQVIRYIDSKTLNLFLLFSIDFHWISSTVQHMFLTVYLDVYGFESSQLSICRWYYGFSISCAIMSLEINSCWILVQFALNSFNMTNRTQLYFIDKSFTVGRKHKTIYKHIISCDHSFF